VEGLCDTTAGSLAQVAANFLVSLFLLLPVNHGAMRLRSGRAQAGWAACPSLGARPALLLALSETWALGQKRSWQRAWPSPPAAGREKPSGSGIATRAGSVRVNQGSGSHPGRAAQPQSCPFPAVPGCVPMAAPHTSLGHTAPAPCLGGRRMGGPARLERSL